MAVYVWKPRLLAAVVTVVAAAAGTVAVIATSGDGGEEAPGIEVPVAERTFYPAGRSWRRCGRSSMRTGGWRR